MQIDLITIINKIKIKYNYLQLNFRDLRIVKNIYKVFVSNVSTHNQ